MSDWKQIKPEAEQTGAPRSDAAASRRWIGRWSARTGKFRPVILLWALGVPIPLVLLFFLIRGCSV